MNASRSTRRAIRGPKRRTNHAISLLSGTRVAIEVVAAISTTGASAAAGTYCPTMLPRSAGGPLEALVRQPLFRGHSLGDKHFEKGLVRHVTLVRERLQVCEQRCR